MKLSALKKLNVDVSSWVSVAKGAAIAAVGAGLTYLTTNISGMDFGDSTAAVVAVFSVFTNYIRKLIFPNDPVVADIK